MSDCRQSTPLGRPVVPPVQIISRSSGDAATAGPVFALRQRLVEGHRTGEVRYVTSVVNRQQQIDAVRG